MPLLRIVGFCEFVSMVTAQRLMGISKTTQTTNYLQEYICLHTAILKGLSSDGAIEPPAICERRSIHKVTDYQGDSSFKVHLVFVLSTANTLLRCLQFCRDNYASLLRLYRMRVFLQVHILGL